MGTGTGGRRARRRGQLRAFGVAVVVTIAAGFGAGTPSPAGAQTACALVPELRDVTINQGLGSYPRLARGKETLVKFFLSMPSCAPTGSSIVRTGGSMQMQVGTTAATIQSSTPAPTSTAPPPLVPYAAGPALASTGDPTFVVPGPVLTSGDPNAPFQARFTATINYSYKVSPTSPAVPGVFQITNRPGRTTPIEATVDKRTNALRVLVVPMGDRTKAFDTQFSAAARTATINGMTTVSRVFPVPSGTADLLSTTGGLRYTVNPALLDISGLMSNGQFCGTGANFEQLKGPLAQMLLSWNTRNPTRPADRVMGVVDNAIAGGSSCADGFGAVGGTVAWARAVPATATSPSRTGAIMAMELGHTLGLVPRVRSLFSDPYHSPNQQADVTAVNRGYNTARRSFVSDDRTTMRVSGSWHNDSVLLERDDWSYLLCMLGGSPGGSCSTPGTVGSSVGVGAEPTFVISGTTTGSPDGTSVVNSYFSNGVPRSEPVASSTLTLVQLDGGTPLRSDLVAREDATSEHEGEDHGTHAGADVFSAAVPFDTNADRIELRQGATVLYARDRTAPPVGGATTVTPGGGTPPSTDRVSVADDESQANAGSSSIEFGVSTDGRFVAFNSSAANLVPGDTNGVTDIFVRDRQTGTTERVSVDSSGAQANGRSDAGGQPIDISADGRYVTFTSFATNLAGTDTNGSEDVFVHDRQTGSTELISQTSTGAAGNFASLGSAISDDGRYVAFLTGASNTVTGGDTNGTVDDVVVRDRLLGTTEVASAGAAQGNSDSASPNISSDGRFVSFLSRATNLVAGDTNGVQDAFVRDMVADTTERTSVGDSGQQLTTNLATAAPRISGNGRYVSFSTPNPMVAGDTNGTNDVFLRDLVDDTTTLVSRGPSAQSNGTSVGGALSQDGRFVAFTSSATNLVTGDNLGYDAFVLDRQTGDVEKASASGGTQQGGSAGESISNDGRYVAFSSSATNLVPGDTNGVIDIFVRDRGVPATGAGDAVTTTGTDDNPEDARVDLSLDCGDGRFYPVAVGLEPSTISEGSVDFAYSFDPAVACTGGQVTALLTDGFSTATTPGEPVVDDPGNRDPLAAIAQPTPDTDLLAYDAISLRGSAKDPEDGELPDGGLSWALDGDGVGTGPVVDLQPPSGGWSPGNHTATLTATDSAGASTSISVSFTIAGDADNDGVSTNLESGCAGTSDTDPTDGYADADDDGIGNGDDVTTAGGPCTAATSYSAVVNVTPDFLDRDNDSGNPVQARITVPFQTAAAVVPSSVRISRIGGVDADITATSVTVSGDVATATFSRAEVNAFLRAQGPNAEGVPFVVTGTGTGGWTFEGTDTVVTK